MIVKLATTWDTVDDLVRHLSVPASRILLRPTPGTATKKDVIHIRRSERPRICELVDGVLIEKGGRRGWREAILATFVAARIGSYLDKHDLGVVLGDGGYVEMFPGRVRIPDAAYFAWERFPGEMIPEVDIAPYAPDLAVEVLSRSNTRAEMRQKREEFFGAGTRLVWEIDPKTETARAYTAADEYTTVGKAGHLDGGEVLPGFKLALKALFAYGKRRRK